MSSIDINIIQRGITNNFEWSAEQGRITAADLDKIGEQRTDNCGALNALPTPFARFFVFKEAFRRVLEQKLDPVNKPAGRAYEHLVSNTLDVFELLYNLKYHENRWKSQDRKIVIKEWNYADQMKVLKNDVPILGNAVESYFKEDLGEASRKLFFVILEDKGKECLLATSSPMTGFITPPDLDLKTVTRAGRKEKEEDFIGAIYQALNVTPLTRKEGGKYFKDILLFENRSEDFKNYMYNKLFSGGATIDARFKELRDYIKAFDADRQIIKNWSDAELEQVYSVDNTALVVNGIPILCSKATDVINYLTDDIIRLPYKIDSDKFVTLVFTHDRADRGFDYLLPLTKEGLEHLKAGDLKISGTKKSYGDVAVVLECNGKKHERYYTTDNNPSAGKGAVLDLSLAKINFDIALFPNVLSYKPEENNYFKILVSATDQNENKTFSVANLAMDFYSTDKGGKYIHIEEATDSTFENGVRTPFIRSQQDSENDCGTKYYELFNTPFSAICAELYLDGKSYPFAIIPMWDKSEPSEKKFSYAIDLGTSNTYISRREYGKMTEPQQLKMDKQIVNYLHAKEESAQKSLISRIEGKIPEEFKTLVKTEFVPALIDDKTYRFPIRTALCVTGDDTRRPVLFDNSNIAFFYEKFRSAGNQTVITNIKWAEDEKNLRVFIREILLLIKADILQENGVISGTEVIWFRPLSFKESIRRNFENIWTEEASNILNLDSAEQQVKCYTESEAPYYYFATKAAFQNVESVAVMDIGGGSTDIVYYAKGEAKIANSVHFGCDVLWENGYNQFVNARDNGIFKHYKDKIHFDTNELKELYEAMLKSNHTSTRDIINLWISNDKETEISKKLRADHISTFVYHYTALVYYMSAMFKANGLPYPRTIIFSGNGSKYIDNYITDSKTCLKQITELIVSKVYETEISDIELVLPTERKESTCYGGLYHRAEAKEPKPVVYLGDGSNGEYKDVEAVNSAYSSGMKNKLANEIAAMNSIYKEVLDVLIQQSVIEQVDSARMKEVVDSVVNDALVSKFQTEILDKYMRQEPFNDTLFFLPVVEAVLQLTGIYKK